MYFIIYRLSTPARKDAAYLEYCKIDVVERKLRTATISAWIHVEKTRCRAIAHPRQAVAVAAKSLVVLHGPQLIPPHLWLTQLRR